jgi:hypothetical protein
MNIENMRGEIKQVIFGMSKNDIKIPTKSDKDVFLKQLGISVEVTFKNNILNHCNLKVFLAIPKDAHLLLFHLFCRAMRQLKLFLEILSHMGIGIQIKTYNT